jgi:glycosyltransferase involved in cell wall biosynthesis
MPVNDPRIDVSVIVAVKNNAATLAQCLESVLTQAGCEVELVVIDALSDDGTSGIISSYSKRISYSVSEPDEGIYDAWNKGLAAARGEWCAFLGADDYLADDNALSSLLQCARNDEVRPVFVFGGIVRTGGAEDYVVHPDPAEPVRLLKRGKMLPHPGALHHAEALRSIGGFDSTFRIAGDLHAVLRLASRGSFLRCGTIVAIVRLGGISSDWAGAGLRRRENRRILEEHRGSFAAAFWSHAPYIMERLGRSVEQAAVAVLGPRRGVTFALGLRRILRRRPRLTQTTAQTTERRAI